MPQIDIDSAPTGHGTGYPEEFAGPCKPRRRWRLGDAVGLDQFGVNLLRLPDGAWSSQRHWHEGEDEFVWVVSGEVVLVEGMPGEVAGETVLRAADCAGFRRACPTATGLRTVPVPRPFCSRSEPGRRGATRATIPISTWSSARPAISIVTAPPIRKSTGERD